MSVIAPLVPFAAIVGYGLGYVVANQINRQDLRRLRMLTRYAAMLENELAVHRRPRAEKSDRRSKNNSTRRGPGK